MKKSTIVLGLVSAFFVAKAVKSVVDYRSAKNKTEELLGENEEFEKQQEEMLQQQKAENETGIEELKKVVEAKCKVADEELEFRASLTQEEVTQEWLSNKKLTPEIVKANRAKNKDKQASEDMKISLEEAKAEFN
jgi:hypothetical protein